MKRNKIIMLATLATTLVGTSVCLATRNSAIALKLRAADASTWSHYDAVASTLRSKGSKGYWVSCSTHEHQFVKPDVDDSLIEEKGAPSQSFIDGLASNDDRLVDKVTDLFDFETGGVPAEFVAGEKVTGFEINSSEGTKGGKCLQVNISGSDLYFSLDKSYLDKVFADSTINAIAFDAKATKDTENWRHRTNGSDPIYEEYQYNNSQQKVYDGLNTTWKTFYFTRSFYESWKDGDMLVKAGGLISSDKIYIDNVRAVTTTGSGKLDFEEGCVYNTWDSANSKFTTNWTIRGTTGQVGFVSGGGAKTVDWDYEHTTSGNRSLHIEKQNGYLAIYASAAFYNSLDDTGFSFDIYTDINNNDGTNAGGIALKGNDNNKFYLLNNWGNPDDGWVTYSMKKSAMGSDGRFLILEGSPKGNVYIDNIRPNKSFASFEHDTNVSTKISDYLYATGYSTITNDTVGGKCRDNYKNWTVLMNGAAWSSASVTKDKAAVGLYSYKLSVTTGGYTALFMPYALTKLASEEGFELKFDMYSTTKFASNAGIGSQVNSNCINKWGTITCSGDLLKDPANTSRLNGRIYCANTSGAGDIYIDNIRLAKAA